ncbi:MAG: response regulator [Bdellovibrionaceae bacterium]|nr:response regulator [Pseudobdellovibrionaceae bacterium]
MKILIIDDSKVVRSFTEQMLVEQGYEVFHAENGQEGIDLISGGAKYDYILLDWNMPILDGPGFLEKYASLRDNQCPVIMMTTESSKEYFQKAIELGASEYIIKPFTPDILFGKIEMVKDAA